MNVIQHDWSPLCLLVGSIAAGWAVGRWRSKHVLFWMYASRTVMVLLYLASPRTDFTFYVFAAALGFTWLATVPPTARLVGKLFGTGYLATLFGLVLLTHQIGAAILNLPIREARMPQPVLA